jgi:hypothetical protein
MIKHIFVPANHVALASKHGELKQVLTAGWHWLTGISEVNIHDMSGQFAPANDLDVLLLNADLAALLEVVEVADNELALLYKNGNYSHAVRAGKYAYWKGLTNWKIVKADLSDYRISADIDRHLIEKGYLGAHTRTIRLEAFEQGILLVNGAMERKLSGGTYHFWNNGDTIGVLKTDMRQITADLSGQEVLTKDKAQLRINFTMQYRVADVEKALLDNKDFEKQLYVLLQMALRELVGRLGFDELMENKDQMAAQVLAAVAEKATDLGVLLVGFGVKDLILPGDVKDIMNQVLIAEKRAQANVIMRREETASTRSLMNTAKLMEDNAMLFKLKEMEYVEKIAEKIHTITLSGGGQVVDQLKQLFVK